MQQLTISLEHSVLQQYPEFMDAVRAAVYGCGKPFKVIAADCDYSPSELSRRLADNPDDIPMLMRKLPKLIASTGSLLPIQWLVEKFMVNDETKQKIAADQLTRMLPQIQAALSQLTDKNPMVR